MLSLALGASQRNILLVLPLAMLLTACGGGSGSSVDSGAGTGSGSGTTSGSSTDSTTSATTTTTTAPAAVAQNNGTCGLANFQSEMLSRVNAYRAAGAVCGGVGYPAVGAVAWDGQLQQAALAHSSDMANNNFFAHQSATNGTTLRDRVPAAGYNYSVAGENIAAGQTSVQAVVQAWMNSPSHCANTMKAEFRDIAVSCVSNAASTYGIYWTMELGLRR